MSLTIEEFDINKLKAGLGKLLHGMKIVNFYHGDDHRKVPNIRAYGGMRVVKGKFGNYFELDIKDDETEEFFKHLEEQVKKHSNDIGVIAKNKEDHITFSVNVRVDRYMDKNDEEKDELIELQFIDSFKFMATSLDLLTNNLVRAGRKLFGFEGYSEQQYELFVTKGVYPYKYMLSWDKLEEIQLLPIEAFYSSLNMSNISDDDYQHAKKVWNEFSIKDPGEYHNLYF